MSIEAKASTSGYILTFKSRKDKTTAGEEIMIEGKDGRNYYSYDVGTEYAIYEREKGERGKVKMIVRIEECYATVSEEEIYSLSYQRGKQSGRLSDMTLLELERYFEATFAEELSAGQEVEFPLLAKEAKWYFNARKKRRKEEREAADKILIGIPEKDKSGKIKRDDKGNVIYEGGIAEYRKILRTQERLETAIAHRIAARQDTTDVSERYRAVVEARKEIICTQGISLSLFRQEDICPICGNKGVDEEGHVCCCAEKISEEIKRFCAGERLRQWYAERWATEEAAGGGTADSGEVHESLPNEKARIGSGT